MIIAIYSRKSRFVEGSDSVENQIQICKDYINRNFKNVEDILIYEDEGFSGGNIERPQFKQMMKDAKSKCFNALICYRLDRISRNIADFSSIINQLQDCNIDFVSIREQFDTSTPMGRAMMYIASVFAQLERETIAERVRDNMLEISKTGKWLGGTPPYGYINIDGILEESDEEMEILEIIYDKYIELGSLNKLYAFLCDKYRNRKDKVFDMTSLRWILTNPTYVIADEDIYNYFKLKNCIITNRLEEFKNNKHNGIMPYNRTERNQSYTRIKQRKYEEWIIALGQHKGRLKSDKWLLVQSMIEANKDKMPRTGTSNVTLLNGLLKCAHCKTSMRAIYKYDKDKNIKAYYYRCILKENSRKALCQNKNVNGQKLEEEIFKKLLKLNLNELDEETLKEQFDLNKDELNSSGVSDQIKDINKQIEKNNNDIEKLMEKLLDAEGTAASKYITNKINEIDSKIKELNNKLIKLENNKLQTKNKEINFGIFKSNIEKLRDYKNLTLEEQKRVLSCIIDTIWWDGEYAEIELVKI